MAAQLRAPSWAVAALMVPDLHSVGHSDTTALSSNEAAQRVARSGVDACGRELNEYREATRLMITNDPRGKNPAQKSLEDQLTKSLVENATSQVIPRILVLRAERKQTPDDSQ